MRILRSWSFLFALSGLLAVTAPALSAQQDSFVSYFNGPEGGIGARDGRGTEARFSYPLSIWSDDTNLYVVDGAMIRKISIATRNVSTVAGAQDQYASIDAVGRNARFYSTGGIWGDGTNLYVTEGCKIRKIVIATAEVSTMLTVDGCSGFGVLWGDGAFLYAAENSYIPVRFETPLQARIRVISLTTLEHYAITMPFSPYLGTPAGIWGINGYLHTVWTAPTGRLAMARTNVATRQTEPMFNASFDVVNSLPPRGLWFDGQGHFYYLQSAEVRRVTLATGEVSTIATLPVRTIAGISALWGVRGELYVAVPQAVMRVDVSTGNVNIFGGLPSNAPDPSDPVTSVLGSVNGIWSDGSNIFVTSGNSVLRIDTANAVSVFATGFQSPGALWGDGIYLYVSDTARIQRISLSTRTVSTLATDLSVAGIWGDSNYLYATGEDVIRRISKTTGEYATFAGAITTDGLGGLVDGIGTAARFRRPVGIWGDGTYLYVTQPDVGNIRRIRIATAEVVTWAGGASPSGSIDGPGTAARFSGPIGIWGDGTNVYVADYFSNLIRQIAISTAQVTTLIRFPSRLLSGDSRFLYVANGQVLSRATIAGFQIHRIIPPLDFSDGVVPKDRFPVRVSWIDGDFLYGVSGHAIYKVDKTSGEITHIAGAFNEPGLVDGVGNDARFSFPTAIWGDARNLYVAEGGPDGPIRRVDRATRQVTTLLGGFDGDSDIWGYRGSLYLATRRTIEKIDLTTLQVSHFAGALGIFPFVDFKDGIGTDARFKGINSMWADEVNNLYVGDQCSIRKVSLDTAQVTTLVGIVDDCRHVDGSRDIARFNTIWDLWSDGRVFFIFTGHTIRTFDLLTGEVRTLAGDPVLSGTENGPGLEARFIGPGRIVGDGATLFVSDTGIRRISLPSAIWTYNVPASARGGGADYRRASSSSTAVLGGFARIQPAAGNETAVGTAIFSYRSNGILVSEAAVPASPLIREGRIYAETGGSVRTGVAFANPNDQAATINFYFTDENGANFGSGSTTIGANRQIAAFLNEAPFNGTVNSIANARSFTFTSSVPVGTIALRGFVNERSEFLMTTLPVAPVSSALPGTILLPHFAAGGGWTTQILLVNPSDTALTGAVSMDGTLTSYSIAPRAATKLVSSSAGSEVRTGSVSVIPVSPGGSPIASTIFSYVRDGVTVTESGVATTGSAQSFRIFAESDAVASLQTGFAIANSSSSAAALQFELLNLDGGPAGYTASLTLAGNGHLAAFLNELTGFQNLPSTFRGVLRISSNTAISVIGLRERYNERNDFLISTTPAIPDNATTTTGELIFPHIVAGGGYTTEFILMSRGNSSSGAVLLRSQSGTELPLPLAR